mmetsp:Transcript_15193/g.63146  ORF Transcript_15193/g.63146 Transcript_15193/m.63146 type:complete len:322 (-) Transcript_15193:179-1144(-)
MRGKLLERLRVRQHGARGQATDRVVPKRQQAHHRRQALARRVRRLREVEIHVARAAEEVPHGAHAVVQRQRQRADGRTRGEAPSNPIPEAEGVLRRDAKARHRLQVRAHGHHVRTHGGLAERRHVPRAHRPRVEHGLGGGEGLGDHHHERPLLIEPLERVRHVDGVDVGQEVQRAALGRQLGRHVGQVGARLGHAVGAVLEGGVHESGAQVRATDADDHDVLEGLAGGAAELAVAHALGEVLDLGEHVVHVRHDVAPVDLDDGVGRGAGRRVQHGAVLGHVDLLAAQHRVDLVAQLRLLGEREQEAHGLLGHVVAGVVQYD